MKPFLIFNALTASCVCLMMPVFADTSKNWRSAQEDNVRIASLNYSIQELQKRDAQAKVDGPTLIFLGRYIPRSKYTDLSDQVMDAFTNKSFIKRYSQSAPGQNNCPSDPKTGERGSLFFAAEFHWKDDKTVDLDGGCDVGFPGSRFWVWHLEQEDGRWVVKSENLTGVG